MVSLIRYGGENSDQLNQLDLPEIEHTVAYGFSQSGRLLRQYMYDGFNADLEDRQVFDGVVPFIAPHLWRSLLLMLKDLDNNQVRLFGLVLMISGTSLLLIIN